MLTFIKKFSSTVATQVGHISDAMSHELLLNFGNAWKKWLFSPETVSDNSYLKLVDRLPRPISDESVPTMVIGTSTKIADRVGYKQLGAPPHANASTNKRQSDISHQRLEAYIALTREKQRNDIDDY